MKLNVNFTDLNNAVEKMGAALVEFNVGSVGFDEIDILLGTSGSIIDPNFLEEKAGLLSYHGRQVLLYIPDQFHSVSSVLEDPSRGNKFHVSDCKTIKDMKNKNRYERYIATNKLDGKFHITDKDQSLNNEEPTSAELKVCQNCLTKLNYKNFTSDKKNVFNTFKLDEFFETFSTLFEHTPSRLNYLCEECKTNFITDKKLLHVHHINGVKSDNCIKNLKSVCIDCHRKEPNHQHIFMTAQELSQIYKLRKNQKLSNVENNWDNVFKLSDISIHGYLNLLRMKKAKDIPEVGYFYKTNKGQELLFDLAWVDSKRAIITNSDIEEQIIDGWQVYNLGGILNKMN